MEMEGIELPPEVREALDEAHREGYTMVMVGVDDRLGGAIELQAAVRPEVKEIIAGLRKRGIKHIAIISGDHEAPTRKLAESLGMDRYFAQVLPADKADYVEKLQKEGCKVCFVGDGINDSIALKKANVSISLRGASSIATDTAHIVFLEEGLAKLCELRDIARDLDHNVKRSWSMILAPNIACIAGVFTMGFGIMASVVTNNVAALAALANGVLPLRKVAQIEAERRHRLEMTQAYATGKKRCTRAACAGPSTRPTRQAINSEFSRRRHEIPVPTELHWHPENRSSPSGRIGCHVCRSISRRSPRGGRGALSGRQGVRHPEAPQKAVRIIDSIATDLGSEVVRPLETDSTTHATQESEEFRVRAADRSGPEVQTHRLGPRAKRRSGSTSS